MIRSFASLIMPDADLRVADDAPARFPRGVYFAAAASTLPAHAERRRLRRRANSLNVMIHRRLLDFSEHCQI